MDNKRIFLEKVKTVILVVLLLMTILLLCFLWYGKPWDKFEFAKAQELLDPVEMSSVIVPQEILISKGGDDFVQNHETKGIIWNDYILPEIERTCASSSIVTEEISKEQYQKVVDDNAVIATFPYVMQFSDFCKIFGIKEFQGIEKIEPFTELGFSMASAESLFLSDPQKGKYYRLIGNFKTDIPKTMKTLVNSEGYQTYYPLSVLTGNASRYNVFLPIEGPKALPELEIGRTLGGASEREHDKIAERYFGNSFDFVRKVKENSGTLVYMYGYGKITLTIDPKLNFIEYKSDSQQAITQTEFQALSTALLFAGQKRCFDSVAGEKMTVILKNITSMSDDSNAQNKRSGYRFEFAILVNGHEIFSGNKPTIVMEVINGEVTYFSKNFSAKFIQVGSRLKQMMQPIDIIVENHELLATKFADTVDKEKVNFDDITHEIRSMQYGYLKQESMLVPVWEIKLSGNTVVYFDPFTGKEVV